MGSAAWRRGIQAGLLGALAGCSSLDSVNPVAWWHDLEGGQIAQDRPPPPNADQPYGNLGEVPGKPTPTDPATRDRIAEALVADRANAQYESSLAPIPPPPPKPKPPAPAAAGDASSASLEAASAPPPPPPPPAKPRRAPVAPVSSSPLPPPAPMPDIPTAPPSAPALAGVPAATAPTPPPATPPPAPVKAAPVVGAPVSVGFAAGSSALPSSALPGLKLLALSRGGGRITVVGYGDANGAEPAAQAAAIPLALARARALAADLLASGVPSSAIQIDAEAAGSGAVARLVK